MPDIDMPTLCASHRAVSLFFIRCSIPFFQSIHSFYRANWLEVNTESRYLFLRGYVAFGYGMP